MEPNNPNPFTLRLTEAQKLAVMALQAHFAGFAAPSNILRRAIDIGLAQMSTLSVEDLAKEIKAGAIR